MTKLVVVVPSIRPDAMVIWFKKWAPVFAERKDTVVVVVWDLPELPELTYPEWACPIYKYCWRDIRPEWESVVHTKSDSVRNLGFLYAIYSANAEHIATLDDDVYPTDSLWADRMLHNLGRTVNPSVFAPAPYRTRGYPTGPGALVDARVVLHHGLWEGVPDVYAQDQGVYQPLDGMDLKIHTIPYGQLFPMCGMNLAFHRSMLPAMYFWPQEKFRRYGDIWCGLVAKKAIDLCHFAATSGSPSVFHSRLSDKASNEVHEAKGSRTNDLLWGQLGGVWPSIKIRTIASATQAIVQVMKSSAPWQAAAPQLTEWVRITRGMV